MIVIVEVVLVSVLREMSTLVTCYCCYIATGIMCGPFLFLAKQLSNVNVTSNTLYTQHGAEIYLYLCFTRQP